MLALGATLLSSVTLCASAVAVPSEPASTTGSAPTELSAALNDVVAAGVPGIIVRVQDGGRAREYAAGVSDRVSGGALRPTDRFRVGSITKTFVATVVLQLVGEGRLRLDEPVAKRLPGLLRNGNRITVRQLLNHTSGLADFTADPALFAGIVENLVWKPRELVALAEKHQPAFPSGSAWGYSNTNYIVAGLLVEEVTGHRLARELDQRIFTPLRLAHTSFPATTARLPGRYAHGYTSTSFIPTPDGQPLDVTGYNPSHAWAAGAVISNAADLSRLYRALMSGALLKPPLLREMKKTVAEDPANPNAFRYGLGLERVQDACGANWGHSGAIFGYQDLAYWNDRTGRSVVIASTMYPAPAAAEPALAKVTDLALCGDLSATQQP